MTLGLKDDIRKYLRGFYNIIFYYFVLGFFLVLKLLDKIENTNKRVSLINYLPLIKSHEILSHGNATHTVILFN